MRMTKEQVFEVWAPRMAAWSPWVKPVVFSTISEVEEFELRGESAAWDRGLEWLPRSGGTALVIDLDGADSVRLGVAVAQHEYRPVVLHNCVPARLPHALGGADTASAVVAMAPVVNAIVGLTDDLGRSNLPPDAPPAFLIDRGRMGRNVRVLPGQFDNRWVVFPQDFPSARMLLAHRVERVLVVTPPEMPTCGDDLGHVLLRWKLGGLSIQGVSTAEREPRDLDLRKPKGFGGMFYRWSVILGLRRNSAGGFGSAVPAPMQDHSSGGPSGGSGFRGGFGGFGGFG